MHAAADISHKQRISRPALSGLYDLPNARGSRVPDLPTGTMFPLSLTFSPGTPVGLDVRQRVFFRLSLDSATSTRTQRSLMFARVSMDKTASLFARTSKRPWAICADLGQVLLPRFACVAYKFAGFFCICFGDSINVCLLRRVLGVE